MSITITIPGVDRSGGAGRVLCDLLPVLGSVAAAHRRRVRSRPRDAVAVTKLLGLRVSM